jgi:glycosyltransferase involved in cell wall biosynthesis
MPRFSIIITCYNHAAFIGEAVESALAQDHPDREILVVDDASTDGSREILARYGTAIRLEAQAANTGACVARNRGAELSRGDFLVFLDGDDLLLPGALRVHDRIVERKAPTLILSSMFYLRGPFSAARIDDRDRPIQVVDYEMFIKKDRPFRASASAMVVARPAFFRVGGWSDGTFPIEDQDLLLKLGCAGRTIQILAPRTTAFRLHGASYSARHRQGLIDRLGELIRKEKRGGYPGGRAGRFGRRVVLGGVAFFFLKQAWKGRFYRSGLRLLAAGGGWILFAIGQRGRVMVRGRHPIETLPDRPSPRE